VSPAGPDPMTVTSYMNIPPMRLRLEL
jgi:hypothetical protein